MEPIISIVTGKVMTLVLLKMFLACGTIHYSEKLLKWSLHQTLLIIVLQFYPRTEEFLFGEKIQVVKLEMEPLQQNPHQFRLREIWHMRLLFRFNQDINLHWL